MKADKDGKIPVEEAVSLLAIHCVARHQTARDFDVMVAAAQEAFHGIAKRATKLTETCSSARMPGLPLSPRQREVPTNIAQKPEQQGNTTKLNVSVRTIKFHVSTLLEKFDVKGRVDLMLESAALLPVDSVHKRVSNAEPVTLGEARPIPLLPSPTTKLRFAATVDRRAGRHHENWKASAKMHKRALIVDDEHASCEQEPAGNSSGQAGLDRRASGGTNFCCR